ASHLATLVDPMTLKYEDVLHGDDIGFHAGDFRDGNQLARAIGHARDLDYRVDRGSNLVPHSAFRNIEIGHGNHIFHAGQCVALRVGVDRGQGTLMARVHGLQHVEGLFATHLAHHDSIRTHTQTVDHQLTL